MEPADRVEYEQDVAVVREQLDEAIFNAVWEAGQQMSLQEAVLYGLAELQPWPCRPALLLRSAWVSDPAETRS